MPSANDRKYFRILDFIGLDYRELDDETYQSLRVANQYAEVPVMDELSAIEHQMQLLFDKVKVRNSEIAELVDLLNQKIQLVIKHSSLGESFAVGNDLPEQQVDISACGIAFATRRAVQVGQRIELELLLQSGRQFLKLLAQVVACDQGAEPLANGESGFTHVVRAEFTDLSDEIQEFLIQYVVKRQGLLLKAGRNPAAKPIDKMQW